jgi:GAF domain-containing protein
MADDWKGAFYDKMARTASQWLSKSADPMSNLSNIAALIYNSFATRVPAEVRAKFAAETLEADSDAQVYDEAKLPRPCVNWSGFYLQRPYFLEAGSQTTEVAEPASALFLGPFVGLPAVTTIPLGRGVCGACAVRHEPILVPNVHDHEDHIPCDSASQSELTIPLLLSPPTAADVTGDAAGTGSSAPTPLFLGLMDLDSPYRHFFTAYDQERLTAIVAALVAGSDWAGWPLPVRVRAGSKQAHALDTPADAPFVCERTH